MEPPTLPASVVPRSRSSFSSINENIDPAAAIPFCIMALTLVSLLRGVISRTIAVMKPLKSPTVIVLLTSSRVAT